MTAQLPHRRLRALSESNEYYSSGDELTYQEGKEAVLTYLKEHGSTVLASISSTGKPHTEQASTNTEPVSFGSLLEIGANHVEETLEAAKQKHPMTNTDQIGTGACSSGIGVHREEDLTSSIQFTASNDKNVTCDENISELPAENDAGDQGPHIVKTTFKPKCFLCSNCCSRIKDGNMLSIGDHIKFGRYSPITKTDRFLRRKLKGRIGFLYYHHAVVTEICEVEEGLISLCVIHFSTIKNEEGKTVIEVLEEPLVNLNLEEEFIYKVEYQDYRSSIDYVLSRARSLKGGKSYNLFTNNCEHVAMWCCTGIKASFQWDNKRDSVEIWSVWFSTMLGKIPHLASVADDIVTATRALFTKVSTTAIVTSVCFPIVAFIVEAILLIRLLHEIQLQLKQKLICLNCYDKKRTLIMAKLVVGFFSSILLMLPSLKYAFPIIGVSVLALVVLPWACEKLITKVKSKINPTSVIPKMPVQSIHDIQPGDVLTVYEGWTGHDIVVEKVQLRERRQTPNAATLDIIHYAYLGLLGTRTIIKETIDIKLDSENLYVFDFPKHRIFSKETTVTRALRNIGEQKFNMFTNRSSHFAWKCKVLPNITIGSVDKHKVTSLNHVEAGDVIQFTYCSLPHVAVVSKAEQYIPSDIIGVDYIHVDKDGKIRRSTRDFDLDDSYVFVQQYSDDIIEGSTVVLDNASKRVGEEYESSMMYKSSRFAMNCKLKNMH